MLGSAVRAHRLATQEILDGGLLIVRHELQKAQMLTQEKEQILEKALLDQQKSAAALW
jgi:hypothetical protein